MKSKKYYESKGRMDDYVAMRNKYKNDRNDRELEFAFARKYRYTKEECEMILKHEMSDVEIGKIIGRTTRAIQKKRFDIKKAMGLRE